eukprot:4542802-Prymnesium_polylepis.1
MRKSFAASSAVTNAVADLDGSADPQNPQMKRMPTPAPSSSTPIIESCGAQACAFAFACTLPGARPRDELTSR